MFVVHLLVDVVVAIVAVVVVDVVSVVVVLIRPSLSFSIYTRIILNASSPDIVVVFRFIVTSIFVFDGCQKIQLIKMMLMMMMIGNNINLPPYACHSMLMHRIDSFSRKYSQSCFLSLFLPLFSHICRSFNQLEMLNAFDCTVSSHLAQSTYDTRMILSLT